MLVNIYWALYESMRAYTCLALETIFSGNAGGNTYNISNHVLFGFSCSSRVFGGKVNKQREREREGHHLYDSTPCLFISGNKIKKKKRTRGREDAPVVHAKPPVTWLSMLVLKYTEILYRRFGYPLY